VLASTNFFITYQSYVIAAMLWLLSTVVVPLLRTFIHKHIPKDVVDKIEEVIDIDIDGDGKIDGK
jgi:hypothetical protein